MWCSKILVAYDGSAPSKQAIKTAREIALQNPHAEFVFVNVLRLYSSGAGAAGFDSVVIEDAAPLRQELEDAANSIPNPSKICLLKGTSPADLIVSCAKKEGCDLIIMGSRGQGGVKGFLGSVSYAVTKESPITVLIAKDGASQR
uniref:Universal stress protein n=1 Tax=Muribaculaceae bacterium Z82 TaxID=2304548 RepID=A0A7C9NVF1_9BACT